MRRKILGVNVDFGLKMPQVVKKIDELIASNGNYIISTTSPYFIMSAQSDPEFKTIINKAELSLPDGVGTLYANYYLGLTKNYKKDILFPIKAFYAGMLTVFGGYFDKQNFGSSITGVDLTDEVCSLAVEKNYSIFLLGGSPRDNKGNRVETTNYDMAKDAASILMKRHPKLRIIGASSAFSREPFDDSRTLEYIHNCMLEQRVEHIDILLVAYNPIYQEKWLQRNIHNIPCYIGIGIGRTFDYITNYMRKPASIYDKLHIAWLYALLLQPWRIKRILMSFPTFPIKVFLESIKRQ